MVWYRTSLMVSWRYLWDWWSNAAFGIATSRSIPLLLEDSSRFFQGFNGITTHTRGSDDWFSSLIQNTLFTFSSLSFSLFLIWSIWQNVNKNMNQFNTTANMKIIHISCLIHKDLSFRCSESHKSSSESCCSHRSVVNDPWSFYLWVVTINNQALCLITPYIWQGWPWKIEKYQGQLHSHAYLVWCDGSPWLNNCKDKPFDWFDHVKRF